MIDYLKFGKPVEINGRSMTRHEIAKRAGLSASTVYNTFNGQRIPAWKTTQKIAEVFGVSVEVMQDELALLVPRLGKLKQVVERENAAERSGDWESAIVMYKGDEDA